MRILRNCAQYWIRRKKINQARNADLILARRQISYLEQSMRAMIPIIELEEKIPVFNKIQGFFHFNRLIFRERYLNFK